MKNNKRKINKLPIFLGYIGFFFMVAVVVTCAVLIYTLVADKANDNNALISITMLIVIFVIALFFTTIDLFRRKLTIDKPVEDILDFTEKIASGDFTARLQTTHKLKNYNEFDYIIENLNTMAKSLAHSETLSNDFISNVSHELKTPLSIICNYSSALQKEKDEEKRQSYTKVLIETSIKLNNLIMNILKLNKLENQDISPEKESVRLGEMIAESVIAFEDLIESKGIEIETDIDEIVIETTPNLLEIVWNNLISNAIKFTPNDGKISILVKEQGGKAIVSISDTGCGISKEIGDRIFDKFYQGDTSHSKDGNGLGLALVKKVINLVGGSISVESEVGKGSTFIVMLDKK